jgi:hypothetical protein
MQRTFFASLGLPDETSTLKENLVFKKYLSEKEDRGKGTSDRYAIGWVWHTQLEQICSPIQMTPAAMNRCEIFGRLRGVG